SLLPFRDALGRLVGFGIDVPAQPITAVQLAAVIDEDTVTRREVDQIAAVEILVEDMRVIAARFMLLQDSAGFFVWPIGGVEVGPAAADNGRLDIGDLKD